MASPSVGNEYVGHVDDMFGGLLFGWAINLSNHSEQIEIDVVLDDVAVATGSARYQRGDIEHVYGSGRHGFVIDISRLNLADVLRCQLRFAGSDTPIPWVEGLREKISQDDGSIMKSCRISPELFGALVSRTHDSVQGWVWSMHPEDNPITVEILGEDTAVASGLADRPNDSLPSIFHRSGFALNAPTPGPDGGHPLVCTARIRGGSVAIGELDPAPDRPIGSFEIVNATSIVGWAERSSDGSAATVSITCDGSSVWEGEACRLLDGREVGFRVDLPEPADWTVPRTVRVRIPSRDLSIGDDVVYWPISRFAGHFDSAALIDGTLVVQGWVSDKARPLDSLRFGIHHGERSLGEGLANEIRDDVIGAGLGGRRSGFQLKARWTMAEPPSSVRLVVADRPQPIVLPISIEVAIADAGLAPPEPEMASVPAINPRDCVWEGSVDTVRHNVISGWFRSELAPDDPVLLDLYIDGSYYYSTLSGHHRADVGRKYQDHGNHGFHFELPPHLIATHDRIVRVASRYGKASFPNEKKLPRAVAGQPLNGLPPMGATRLAEPPTSAAVAQPKIAFILLNLDAEHLLLSWFETFSRHNRYGNYEIVIVDHGSTDGSLGLCETWSERLPVRVLTRGRNYSFSDSNNFGVENTDADIFIFCNNDIVFVEDVTNEIVRLLADDTIGMVGVKLFDTPLGEALFQPPIQHLGVHFSALAREDAVQPFETRYGHHLRDIVNDVYDVPVVTGALMACRRADFEAVGGFDPGYFYGCEDVDLCLRLVLDERKRVVSANSIGAMHMRGFSRGRSGPSLGQRLANNRARLHELFGRRLRRRQALDRFERTGFWSSVAPRIAFAVTEASDTAVAGDYFTAMELALELAKIMPCQIVFLGEPDWYNLMGIDVLVTMIDRYDLRRIQNASPHLLRIGWARNWIDRWAARDWSQDYDAMWASSRLSVDYLSRALARRVDLIQIATNPGRFQTGTFRPELASDYCFTGNYFSAPREIIYYLDPEALPFDFAIYGSGWEGVPKLAAYSRNSIPYARMPDVYASTRIVIDDANSVTKEWASVNSRVFDAIAAGALVITNGRAGADEMFDGLLPSYTSSQELEAHLRHFLTDEASRRERVAALQAILLERHTYGLRAAVADASIRTLSATQLRFSIKIGAPREAVRNEWGDYHFALGLKRALTRLGHTVRIDCLDRWQGLHTVGDDVVLVLRGLSAYEPKPHQLNLLWIISHPDAIARAEIERYDHVFVASALYAEELGRGAKVPVTPLLQCTDPELFNPDVEPLDPAPGLLFVGNSRNVQRPIVKDALEAGLSLEVYGTRWENFVPAETIKGTYVPNEQLARYYRSAAWVLNDHWEDMRRCGFISNRIFDAVAAGGRVVTDEIAGLSAVFGDGVATYRTKEGLRDLLGSASDRSVDESRIRDISDRIRRDHSFAARAAAILAVVSAHPDMLSGQPAGLDQAAGAATIFA